MATRLEKKLTKKDFITDQEVRWCPGCGDYAILNAVQMLFPTLGIPREKFVVISGIGCAARFPYYMNTYGFHTIHGRAPAVATGVKIANPDLSVWVVSGDGDALSIGGNHLIHALRRNIDLKILLFDNHIYGLTKGQYSPTSEVGKINKSAPLGVVDRPLNPISLAIATGATFVARAIDVHLKHLQDVLRRAAEHRGSAIVQIFQNCNIFNDGAFAGFREREVRDDACVALEHGKPLLFGKKKDKGIRIQGLTAEVVTLGENGVTEKDVAVHDEKCPHPTWAQLLSRLSPPAFPMPIGVLRKQETASYERSVMEQVAASKKKFGKGDLKKLLHAGDTWEVK